MPLQNEDHEAIIAMRRRSMRLAQDRIQLLKRELVEAKCALRLLRSQFKRAVEDYAHRTPSKHASS